MKIVIILLGLFVISRTDACANCMTRHPQRHFCDADFAMRMNILDISRNSVTGFNLVTAEILSNWKKGPSSGEFQFYAPSSFCGTNFAIDRVYVVTGMKERDEDGMKYWSHGSCDFAKAWDDLSAQQKQGFRQDYKETCYECEVSPIKFASGITVEDLTNDYKTASTFWTPTNCYYNPHKSQEFARSNSGVEDCEDEYGLCTVDRDGECSWKTTASYKQCFNHRDNYVLVDSGDFAITDISQCDVYTSKRKRRNCRRRIREQEAENANYGDDILIL